MEEIQKRYHIQNNITDIYFGRKVNLNYGGKEMDSKMKNNRSPPTSI